MKSFNLILLVTFLSTLTLSSQAQSKSLPEIDLGIAQTIVDFSTPSDNIFFIDPEENILFIDFLSVKDQIIRIDIIQNGQKVFDKDVQHLSKQTIYELPAHSLLKGICKVEIITRYGFKYTQEIIVKSIEHKSISLN